MKNKIFLLAFIIAVGFGIRVHADYYEWIDEVLFINIQTTYDTYGWIDGIEREAGREALLSSVCYFLGIDTVFKARWISLIAGTLCVLAIFLIAENKTYGLLGALFIATCPLLIFWSQFIRPYTLAGLFVLLGFKWKWWYIPAILVTPMAIIGINWYEIKERWIFYIILIICGGVFYSIMPEVSKFNHWRDLEFITTARRIWVIPTCVFVAYMVNMPLSWQQWLQHLSKRLV